MDTLDRPLDKTVLGITDIMALLPHRYPFLMLDRVLELERKKRIVAIKNITINEPFFEGHFPDYPIMPGVMVVEAIAQAGGVLVLLDLPQPEDKLMVFTGIEKAKFRRPAGPGDQLRIEVNVLNWRMRAIRIHGRVTIDDKVACEATVMCALTDRAPRPQHHAPESAAETTESAAELVTVSTD